MSCVVYGRHTSIQQEDNNNTNDDVFCVIFFFLETRVVRQQRHIADVPMVVNDPFKRGRLPYRSTYNHSNSIEPHQRQTRPKSAHPCAVQYAITKNYYWIPRNRRIILQKEPSHNKPARSHATSKRKNVKCLRL